jgi:hypothetical protein
LISSAYPSSDPGKAWPSKDRLEAYVRYCLVNQPKLFENHVAKGLPRMTATIPGQYDSQHGIDIIAIDAHNPRRRMWLIEISRGREMGAGLVKQLDKRKYAGYQSQMSYRWRRAAADLFLQKNPKSTEMLQALFDMRGAERELVEGIFETYFELHRAAVVVPAGCDVVGSNTGLRFSDDIYTFTYTSNSPPRKRT